MTVELDRELFWLDNVVCKEFWTWTDMDVWKDYT